MRLVGHLLTLGSLVFLVWMATTHAAELSRIDWTAALFAALAFATVAAICANTIAALAWRLLVNVGADTSGRPCRTAAADPATDCSDERPPTAYTGLPRRAAIAIWFRSNGAKYIPGNVFHYASRWVLARHYGLPTDRILFSMSVELMFVLAAAVIVAGPAWLEARQFAQSLPWPNVDAYGTYSRAALVTAITCAGLLIGLALRDRLRQSLASVHALLRAAPPAMVAGTFVLYLLPYILIGTSAWAVLACLDAGASATLDPMRLTAIYSIAFLAGFLLPGAPGGLGVREAALVALLATISDTATVLLLAAVLRAATMLADAMCYLLALGFERSLRANDAPID